MRFLRSGRRTLVNALLDAFDADALSYFSRASVTDGTAKSKISPLIVGLKAQALWSLLTGFWIGRSAYNAGSGTTVYDLQSNVLNGTMVNSPAWGANGIVFTGGTQAVATGRTQTMNGSWSAFTVIKIPTAAAVNRRILGHASSGSPALLGAASATMSATPLITYDGLAVASAGSIDITNFRLIGQTYSVANKQNFYSGASSIGTAAVANAAASHTVHLSSAGGEGMTDATMAVAMIFGATELTGPQISSLYSLLKTTICSDLALP
jgi:hypothetical protein